MPLEPIDLSHLSPQRGFLQSHPSVPDGRASRTIDHTTTENADHSKNHRIVGFHLVIQAGHANGLHEILHTDPTKNRQNPRDPMVQIRRLEIFCDTLEIQGEWRLPETNLTVHARRLIWADDTAAINTSPLAWTLEKAQDAGENSKGEDGAHGRHAGAMKLWVKEVVNPEGTRVQQRLISHGGNGQDSGNGRHGRDGASRRSWSELTNTALAPAENTGTVHFDPVAVKIQYGWTWVGIPGTSGVHTVGGDFPTSGTDAQGAGKPGNAGNGGLIQTNNAMLHGQADVKPGRAGRAQPAYRGGAAGTPTRSAQYRVRFHLNAFGTNDAGSRSDITAGPHTTTRGQDAPAQQADIPEGQHPDPQLQAQPAAWLHPLQLRRVLEFARDLFLGEGRVQLESFLPCYEAALAGERPDLPVWRETQGSHWTSAVSEIAVLMQRLRANLDFFGNPAGFMPFLSLRSSIQLYEQELDRALQMLLLTQWVHQAKDNVQQQADILAETLDKVNDQIQQTAADVVQAEAQISEYRRQISDLQTELEEQAVSLTKLENELSDKAANDAQAKALIRFGIKTAGALMQVIPVGQPMLGTVGSLAGTAADLINNDPASAPDTIGKIGQVFEKAHAAAEKAEDTRMKVKTFRDKFSESNAPIGEDGAEVDNTDWIEKAPSRREAMLHKAGAGLGPALSQFSGAMATLQVPAAEVEAELQRLSTNSPEWQKLTEKIRDLNQRKTTVLTKMARALHKLGAGYADLSAMGLAAANMQQARTDQLVRLDLDSAAAVQEMGQRARNTLIYYLYLMVKAYETTLLTPIEVDWSLNKVTEKIVTLLQGGKPFSAARLIEYGQVLKPIFQGNLTQIRDRLLADFNFTENNIPLQFALSATQTPAAIDTLNQTGRIDVDPLALGLVLPDRQAARISEIVLTHIEFDEHGAALPENHNLVLRVEPDRDGTLRRAEALFAIFAEQPLSWGWSYFSSAAENERIRRHTPSAASEDMLQFILGNEADSIRQKMALPPVWSRLRISAQYAPPLPQNRRPRITRLRWTVKTSSSAAPQRQRVLQVERKGLTGAAEIHCPPDLAARSAGLNRFYRIFGVGSAVRLEAPDIDGAAAFEAWDLVGMRIDRPGITETTVAFNMDDHVFAQSQWRPAQAKLEVSPDAEEVARLAEHHDGAELLAALSHQARRAPAAPHYLMRTAPKDDATVIGICPAGAAYDVLQKNQDGWEQVQQGPRIGWIKP